MFFFFLDYSFLLPTLDHSPRSLSLVQTIKKHLLALTVRNLQPQPLDSHTECNLELQPYPYLISTGLLFLWLDHVECLPFCTLSNFTEIHRDPLFLELRPHFLQDHAMPSTKAICVMKLLFGHEG